MNSFTRLYYKLRETFPPEGQIVATFDFRKANPERKQKCTFCGNEAVYYSPENGQMNVNRLLLQLKSPSNLGWPMDIELYWVCKDCLHVCSKIVELFERSKK
jgi:hypothetical protein